MKKRAVKAGLWGRNQLPAAAMRVEAQRFLAFEDRREAFEEDVAQVQRAVGQCLPRLFFAQAVGDEVLAQLVVVGNLVVGNWSSTKRSSRTARTTGWCPCAPHSVAASPAALLVGCCW